MGKQYLKLVKPKLQARSVMDKTEIDSYVMSVYEGITNKQSLKFLPSFILFLACCVEEAYSKKSIHSSKVDKLGEVLEHINTFLGTPLPEADKLIIISIIEDLHSSGRIKKISMAQKLVFTIGKFFLSTV